MMPFNGVNFNKANILVFFLGKHTSRNCKEIHKVVKEDFLLINNWKGTFILCKNVGKSLLDDVLKS